MTHAAHGSATQPVESPFTRATDTRVRHYVERGRLLKDGERAVVAVSGGQDSTALLLILSRLAPGLGFTLSAAHFDHQLRDAFETVEDRRFIQDLCASLGMTLVCGSGDVAGRVREQRETVEEAARNLRYEFLASAAEQAGAGLVVVGHTRDDRAETVLMHIIRGSGLDGLAVMGPRSPWPFGGGPDVARPLLELSREETRRYCLESAIQPRDDATNELLIATRNRVRHELMPALRAINPRVDEALCRLADAAEKDAAFLDAAADVEWRSLAHERDREIAFPRAGFRALHPALAARAVRRAAVRLGAPAPPQERVDQVMSAAAKGSGTIELPGGVVVVVNRDRLRVRESGGESL